VTISTDVVYSIMFRANVNWSKANFGVFKKVFAGFYIFFFFKVTIPTHHMV